MKPVTSLNGIRESGVLKDSRITIQRGDTTHIISENYSYKTETYYTILQHELDGNKVKPSSSAVLDAYVVPICLERARLAGIPVCEWGISQGYFPSPAIIYGLNYFATNTEYFIVHDSTKSETIVKHITNSGKYPFCYQKLDDGATVHSCIAIFGETSPDCSPISTLSKKVYELFGLPLVTMIFVKNGNKYLLSSLTPTKYSQLSQDDVEMLKKESA